MKRKPQPVMRVIAKTQEPVEPTLDTDGRKKKDWTDRDCSWSPFSISKSAWGSYAE